MLTELRDAMCGGWAAWLPHVDESIRPIVGKRMVPFCKEVSFAIEWLDLQLWADYFNGILGMLIPFAPCKTDVSNYYAGRRGRGEQQPQLKDRLKR